MADTITINGDPFAVDVVTLEDGTPNVKVARDKVGFGVDGAYVDVSGTDPLPVTDATVVAAVTALAAALETVNSVVSGTVALDGATLAALESIQTRDAGTYAYKAGTAAGTVDVPAGARLTRVSVIAGASVAATVAIGGGDTITIPSGGAFDEQVPGDATNADVVIGGTVQSYYVAWVV